jgi:multisubunit Na+/H+ antiporter MnhG subunit
VLRTSGSAALLALVVAPMAAHALVRGSIAEMLKER